MCISNILYLCKQNKKIYGTSKMIKITQKLLDQIILQAKQSPRKRINYNLHTSDDALLQRLLNALEPGTYIRPHKHETPPKHEVFTVLRGRLLLVEFEDDGAICDFVVLDKNTDTLAVEIPPHRFHTILSLESGSVAFEFKEGPYIQETDKIFAEWAPEEGSDRVAEYLEMIRKATGI